MCRSIRLSAASTSILTDLRGDLGLPVYPGATTVNDDENHRSADVHLGFGQWQLRVKTVSYAPPTAGKSHDFYKRPCRGLATCLPARITPPSGRQP